jgi:hypothetical protein
VHVRDAIAFSKFTSAGDLRFRQHARWLERLPPAVGDADLVILTATSWTIPRCAARDRQRARRPRGRRSHSRERMRCLPSGRDGSGLAWKHLMSARTRMTMSWDIGRQRAPIVSALITDRAALGSHGPSGLAQLLLGSGAEAVICAATCDVLVAREPAAPAETLIPQRR